MDLLSFGMVHVLKSDAQGVMLALRCVCVCVCVRVFMCKFLVETPMAKRVII